MIVDEIQPGIYSDPIPGREFTFRVGDGIARVADTLTGYVVARGRRSMYEHVYLVRFWAGGQQWLPEPAICPD